ncbi:hypothetical protein HHO41_12575 [Bacillus sp. DNRA2]|uniref:hypothetical protein n=1 Tax=Bacillus sp. DNRA2 TaxID=2723053 RepID=UPI00145EC6E6|nr:hypothetical protein [Bacillus sp. DNRA2]NMD71134.1 hypothetical protein [Bacillus sp. DNRA2]
MDRQQFEQLGDELREIGHKRRKLAEQVFQEVQEGDGHASKELYQELSHVSEQAIDIIMKQKQIFDEQVQSL